MRPVKCAVAAVEQHLGIRLGDAANGFGSAPGPRGGGEKEALDTEKLYFEYSWSALVGSLRNARVRFCYADLTWFLVPLR